MRTFTLHPVNVGLITAIGRFQQQGPGALPAIPGAPPTGLDQENLAFFEEIKRTLTTIHGQVAYWRNQAVYEHQAAVQAAQTMSTP